MKKILILVGTRPNFIKITKFRKEAEAFSDIDIKIVHTGQHFDQNMAEVFFTQFSLTPDYFLNISPKSPLNQMGEILIKLEELIKNTYYPDLIITPGDVNSTLAVALVANKLNIPLAHLESGLRSDDRAMPEEINRILTDEITDYYFITEKSGIDNLINENKKGQLHFVGNTMIDTLVAFENEINQSDIIERLGLGDKFILMTIHRPSNVDSKEGLLKLAKLIERLSEQYSVIFPIHPRTRKNINNYKLQEHFKFDNQVKQTDALGYFEFQKLVKNAKLILTDSGGIQEETTFRQIPCITLRDNTERPITTDVGTNTLAPFEIDKIIQLISKIESGNYKKGEIPEKWDGKSTQRILEIINDLSL